MIKKRLLLVMLIVHFLLVSCSNTISTKPAESTPITTPSKELMPTETAILSPTPMGSQEISQTCTETNNDRDLKLNGIAVFDNLSSDLIVTVFLHDLETTNISTLSSPGEMWHFWGISPNRKYILYEYERLLSDDFQLVVADSRGQLIEEFDYGASYYDWHSDERIRAVFFSETAEAIKMSPRIYDPFTDNYQVLRVDWPDVYIGADLDWRQDWIAISTGHYQGANVVYDPAITRVLYPKNDETVSLTDVETGKELASAHFPEWGRLPKWSPDDKHLALIATAEPNSSKASDEIFIVQRDGGEFIRFTYFSNTFQQSAISDYAWSPDGTQIAFWSYTDIGDPNAERTQSELMILNVITGEVTNLCVRGISTISSLGDGILFARLEPIWSPDGNQIMISQWDAPEDQNDANYSVLVVDLPSLRSVKIDENKQPAGWMVKVP